jgi:hypothetical protein
MIKDSAFQLVVAMIYLAILYMLVRPNSNGPQLIKNVLGTLSDLVRGVVGYTYNSSTGQWEAPSGGTTAT